MYFLAVYARFLGPSIISPLAFVFYDFFTIIDKPVTTHSPDCPKLGLSSY